MESQTNELTLRELFDVVARQRWVVVGTVLGCVILALALVLVQPTKYTAESEVQVQLRSPDLFQNQTAPPNDLTIQTQIQVMESQAVRDRVQQDLGLEELPPEVNATAVPQTNVVSLAVSDANATNAALYANAYATAYIDVYREQVLEELLTASNALELAIADVQGAIDEVEALNDGEPSLPSLPDELASFPSRSSLANQLAEFSTTLSQLRVDAAVRTGGTTIIRVAEVPGNPDGPTPASTFPLAVVVGLVLGLLAAFLIDYLDDKIRTEDDLAELVALPVLAAVPFAKQSGNRPIAIGEPSHTAVEAYRDLRTNLRFLGRDHEIRVIQVTSPVGNEGKTSTATNFAVVLAQAGHRVALVDANLRQPRVHEVLAIPQTPGLTDLLLGMDAIDVANDVIVDGTHTLSAYTSGNVPSNPSELLSGQRTQQLLGELGALFDYVIVDSASVLGVSDAVALSGLVDSLLLVVQADHTTRDQLTETLGRLEQVAAPVAGIVLTRAPANVRSRKSA